MSSDAIYNEIREIRGQMDGISKKTETWQKLNARLLELKKKVGGQSIGTKKQRRVFAPVGSHCRPLLRLK